MPPQSPLATPVASLQPEVTPVGSGGLDVWLVAVGVVVAVVAAAVSVLVLKGKVRAKR